VIQEDSRTRRFNNKKNKEEIIKDQELKEKKLKKKKIQEVMVF